MPYYCVNTNAQANGDHEVHNTGTCTRLPKPEHQLALGYHETCKGAVQQAKRSYSTANGCYYCCPDCNTG
jgi:hypothetical protein